jgi:hypothetical protein
MRNDHDHLRHVEQGKCPIGAYAWGNHDAVEKWNTRALRSATPMPEPVAWIDATALVWSSQDLTGELVPLYPTPPAREISEAEVERAAIPPAPKPVEDLLSILAEIVAISDRDHVAWRRAKALIEMSRVTNHSHQIARGDR